MSDMLPINTGTVSAALRENPNLQFVITTHAEGHYTIRIRSKTMGVTYLLHTARGEIRTFTSADSAIKVLHKLRAKDIRVCTIGMGERT